MKVAILLLLAAAAVCTANNPAKKRYDGYHLYRVYPADKVQTDFVVEQEGDSELDFWYEGRDRFDILVPPHKLVGFELQMSTHGVKFEIFNKDIQRDIDIETLTTMNRNVKSGQAVDYDNFNTFEDIMDELDNLAARCPATAHCETFIVGSSYQGREIKGLHIWNDGNGRKAIWLDATIHAREWLATATHLKIMKHLIDDYADANVADLLSKYDFWLVPVSNPDGYSYTWTNDRMWRKNRSPNAGQTCLGTDLNRNYNEQWGNAGASTQPCQETYRGTAPASEIETQWVQAALVERGPSLLFSIHFHTYGSLWLMPWGSVNADGSCKYATNNAEMLVVANAAANAVQNTYNIGPWARGNSCATIYPASGITMDFARGVAGVATTFTPELRGNNFVIAANQIQPSFVEVWNGVLATVRTLEAQNQK
jgi:carboxypeptidase A2